MLKKKIIPYCKPKRDVRVDWKLLKKLLSYRTYSGDEKAQKEFSDYLCSYIFSLGIIKIEEDSVGNLYITKGECDLYPCIVAHQDISQDVLDNVSIIQTSKYVFGFDNEEGKQCGLGFDDKCGIYFALHCLKTMDNIKVFFPVLEEWGCLGTADADMIFFEDCSFLIQLDRNSWANDVSYHTNGVDVVSEDFMAKSGDILNKYNYAYAHCNYTDVGELVKQGCGICAVNISNGSFNEHFEDEILSIPHFINAIAFGEELINTMRYKKWPHTAKKEITYSKSMKKGHFASGWNFTKEDEPYVQSCLAVGECPLCQSNQLELLSNGTVVCDSCESYYNIKNFEDELELEY
jgi:tripeptide aminopeptidase